MRKHKTVIVLFVLIAFGGVTALRARPEWKSLSHPVTFQFKAKDGKNTLLPIIPMRLIVEVSSGNQTDLDGVVQCKIGRESPDDPLTAVCGKAVLHVVGFEFEKEQK